MGRTLQSFGLPIYWNLKLHFCSGSQNAKIVYLHVIYVHFASLRVGLNRISSQLPVSDLGEWRHICHFFRWQKMRSVPFGIFLGRMWRARTRKYIFELVTFLVTSFPKNVTFWPRRYKTFLNGKKCDDSAGTETHISPRISDVSLISEAWSGKAIWVKTDPNPIV